MKPRSIVMLALTAVVMAMAFGSSDHHPGSAVPDFRDVSDLSLASLEALPPDPGNRWADDAAAAALGRKLFFDERLSGNGHVSCATCHVPGRDFQDGLPLGKGMGTTGRRTMPIAGAAYSSFFFWDGRKDSLWSQALGPLESKVEHGGDRGDYARVVATSYRDEYRQVFGALPELGSRTAATRVFVNIGKAIEAYERRIEFRPSRFDRFVAEWRKSGSMPRDILDEREVAGLALFVGKAACVQCHNGPLFTNNEFTNTGVPARVALPADKGRAPGIRAVSTDEFNCRSRWSDAKGNCMELTFLAVKGFGSTGAFKVPSLRNVADRAPYMHAGQFATLEEVLDHYNRAPKAPSGHSQLKPLGLTRTEIGQLEAFLRTLSGGVSAPGL